MKPHLLTATHALRFRATVAGCAATIEEQGKDWWLSHLYTAEIHKRGALQECRILFGAPPLKLEWVVDPQYENPARFDVDRRHPVGGKIERGHAVYPGVHVPPVECGKPENSLEHVVETVPVGDLPNGDRHGHLLHNGQ
jgi:hypothetical protein